MAQNFPGPYEVEIEYVVGDLRHIHRVSCDVVSAPAPGTDPTLIELQTKGGTPKTLDAAIDEYIPLVQPFFSASDASFVGYNFWKYEPQTFDRSFITTAQIGLNGTNPSPYVKAGQGTYTFRSSEGGRMRLTWLEHSLEGFFVTEFADLGADASAYMSYVLSSGGWILARDTSYPIVGLRQLRGQNEVIFRKRFRP